MKRSWRELDRLIDDMAFVRDGDLVFIGMVIAFKYPEWARALLSQMRPYSDHSQRKKLIDHFINSFPQQVVIK